MELLKKLDRFIIKNGDIILIVFNSIVILTIMATVVNFNLHRSNHSLVEAQGKLLISVSEKFIILRDKTEALELQVQELKRYAPVRH